MRYGARGKQMMKLSEQLKQDHESGDFGKALEGYAERAEELEEIVQAVAHIGIDWGFGKYQMLETDSAVGKARKLMDA
jgi:molybdate-binding protein